METISIIIPAKNEASGLKALLPEIRDEYNDAEIIVVDDGSTDNSREVAEKYGARVISHPYSIGNGGAVKSGARAAKGRIFVFMDADGQHEASDIKKLLRGIADGFDMVVGQRNNTGQANISRNLANKIYNAFASLITGQDIKDLTSGFRAVKAEKFLEYLYLLPNGFSYPSTITMAFFRSGYTVSYVPINVSQRIGTSHIRPVKDGARFLIIIFKIGTLYSPLKIFAPVSFAFFVIGASYYAYTFLTQNRFTNMSALMLVTAIMTFLIGLVSEQVATLIYRKEMGANTKPDDE